MSSVSDFRGASVPVRRRATQAWAPNAELFVQRAGLHPCPDYYADSGASTAHLNGQVLEDIRAQIRTHVGGAAAENYVRMVEDIPYLSAEAFLTMLYTLEFSSWKWEKSLLLSHREFSSRSSSSIMSTSGAAHQRDETQYIKAQFIERLSGSEQGVKLEKYSW
jgi:hypothetical protein